MDFGLKNRRALVMGGTKGLGRSIADALAEEGAAVTISGRDQGRLDEAAMALRTNESAAALARRRNIGFEEALAERLADAAAQIPAGRVGTPGEYGPMGAFLASDKAGYITGSMIRVDGGRIRGMV